MRKNPEQQVHFQVAGFLKLVLRTDVFFTTFPAGGGGKLRGAFLKRMGLVPGVPDVLIVYQGRAYWIELKSDSGQLSKTQKDTIAALNTAGSHVMICHSVEEVSYALSLWKIPTRIKKVA